MITPLYHLRVLNTPGRRLLSANVVRYEAPKQRPGDKALDKGQGQKPEVTSDSRFKTPEKPHIKKAPGETPTPQPTKTPEKTSRPQPFKNTPNKTSRSYSTKSYDKSHKTPRSEKNGAARPLERFFSQYSKFQYHPTISPTTEFNRLCEEYGWKKAEREDARRKFNHALRKELDFLYGPDEKDIKIWYYLCHDLRIDPVPKTLRKCREAVRAKHVNLVDFVGGTLGGSRENIRIFETEEELSKYTRLTEKFFPKEDAADSEVLRALRRHIFHPRTSHPTRGHIKHRVSSTVKGETFILL